MVISGILDLFMTELYFFDRRGALKHFDLSLQGSLRSRRGINLSVDDAFPMSLTASISPQGTLRDNEGKKQKPANKLTTLFSPLNKVGYIKLYWTPTGAQ